jgi:hypothetical protein
VCRSPPFGIQLARSISRNAALHPGIPTPPNDDAKGSEPIHKKPIRSALGGARNSEGNKEQSKVEKMRKHSTLSTPFSLGRSALSSSSFSSLVCFYGLPRVLKVFLRGTENASRKVLRRNSFRSPNSESNFRHPHIFYDFTHVSFHNRDIRQASYCKDIDAFLPTTY